MGSVPLVIGSWATHYWFPEFRKGTDIDCYAFNNMKPELSDLDVQVITKSNGLLEITQLGGVCDSVGEVKVWVAPTSTLLAIKRIHLEFQRKWLKNVCDYVWLLNRGLTLDERTKKGFEKRAAWLRNKFRENKDYKKIPSSTSAKELARLVRDSEVSPVSASEFFLDCVGHKLVDI